MQYLYISAQASEYLKQVWHILMLHGHSLGAAQGGIGCHVNACLLTPLYHPVIPEVAVDLYLHDKDLQLCYSIVSANDANKESARLAFSAQLQT